MDILNAICTREFIRKYNVNFFFFFTYVLVYVYRENIKKIRKITFHYYTCV